MRPIDLLHGIMPEMHERKERGLCPTCGGNVDGFRDELSMREFQISGMCQECQDGVFVGHSDDEEIL